jgi:broad specificity phosphatase PhoE
LTQIILARHGETDWNRESRFQGHADPPLNGLGRQQAAELAEALAGEELAAVYSSPLRRALETAQVIAARHGLEAVPVEALREVHVGSWQGLTRDEIEQRFPEQFQRWLDYGQGWDDGETYDEMGKRAIAALQELAARNDGNRIVAVTHGGPIRAALARAGGISHTEARRRGPAIDNCFVARLAVQDGDFRRVDSAE